MRFLAALLIFGPGWYRCERRITVEAQPPVYGTIEQVEEKCQDRAGYRTVLRTEACQLTITIYERYDGLRRAEQDNVCTWDYFMTGPCT